MSSPLLQVVDGVQVYTFRQSFLNEFLLCPERARQQWQGLVEDSTSAEAAIGTAVHFAIELLKTQGSGFTGRDAYMAAVDHFRAISEEPGFKWVKVKTFDTACRHIGLCIDTFINDIDRHVGVPLAIEHTFRVPLYNWSDWDRKGRLVSYEIWLEGTIDLIDQYQIWDWKTCSRISKYTNEFWQLDRWGIQPTVYTWAARELGFFEGDSVPFTYGAMQRTPAVSAMPTCWRDQRHWDWLTRQCIDLARLMEKDPHGPWPTNDQHALCSADWCPSWSQCKGKHMDVDLLAVA